MSETRRAVLVIELDLPADDRNALMRAVDSLGKPVYATQLHAAIDGCADDVLRVLYDDQEAK